jgi:uncharacterized membrane protein YkvA (DUF1232 family)
MSERRTDLAWFVAAGLLWLAQLLYLVSPIDLLPDVFPVTGWADDALAFLVTLTVTGAGAYKLWKDRPQLDATPRLEGARYGTEAYEPLSPDQIRSL